MALTSTFHTTVRDLINAPATTRRMQSASASHHIISNNSNNSGNHSGNHGNGINSTEDAWIPRSPGKLTLATAASTAAQRNDAKRQGNAVAAGRAKAKSTSTQPSRTVNIEPEEVQSLFDLLPFQTHATGGASSPATRRRTTSSKTTTAASCVSAAARVTTGDSSSNTNVNVKTLLKFFRLVQDVPRPAILDTVSATAVFADLTANPNFGADLLKYLHIGHLVHGGGAEREATTTTAATTVTATTKTTLLGLDGGLLERHHAVHTCGHANGAVHPLHSLQHQMMQQQTHPYQSQHQMQMQQQSRQLQYQHQRSLSQLRLSNDLQSRLSEGALEILRSPNAGGNSILSEALAFEFAAREWGARLLHTEMELRYFPAGGSMLDFTAVLPSERCILAVSVTRAMVYPKFTASTAAATAAAQRKMANLSSSANAQQAGFSMDDSVLPSATSSADNSCRRRRRRRRHASASLAMTSMAAAAYASVINGTYNEEEDYEIAESESEEGDDMMMMDGQQDLMMVMPSESDEANMAVNQFVRLKSGDNEYENEDQAVPRQRGLATNNDTPEEAMCAGNGINNGNGNATAAGAGNGNIATASKTDDEAAWGLFRVPTEPIRNARFEREQARNLLNKKLCGLQYAVRNVMIPAMKEGHSAAADADEDMSEWPVKPVLFIWCMSEQAANTVAKIYARLDREVRGNALVYQVVAEECPWLFWNLRRAKNK